MTRLGLVVVSVATTLAAGARADTLVHMADLDQACKEAELCPLDNPSLKSFCDVASGLESLDPTDQHWGTLTLPTAADVLAEAKLASTGKCLPSNRGPAVKVLRAAISTSSLPLGGAQQSSFLWGFTDYIVDRGGKELDQWAMDNVLGNFCGSGQYATLRTELLDGGVQDAGLFPQTCQAVNTFKLDDISSSASALQGALRTDLLGLPGDVLGAVALTAAADKPKEDAAMAGVEITDLVRAQLSGGSWETELARFVNETSKLTWQDQPARSALYVMASFDAVATDPKTGKVNWPDGHTAHPIIVAILSVLIDANDKTTAIGNGWPTGAPPFTSGSQIISVLKDIGPRLTAAQTAAQSVKPTTDRAGQLQAFGQLIGNALQAVAMVVKDFGSPSAGTSSTQVTDIADCASQIGHGLAAENYTESIIGLLNAISAFDTKLRPQQLRDLKEVARLLQLVADVSQASTPSDMDAAIERFAAPVGSYKLKRTGGWYGRVNAYLGVDAALEYNLSGPANTGVAPGVWAGVGLEGGIGSSAGSFGLFLQAIDLGVLASWRINTRSGDTSSNPPQVGFQQVFAPGGYIVWGIPKAPFSIALGAELAPSLRSINNGTGVTSNVNVIRTSAAFALDLPLYP